MTEARDLVYYVLDSNFKDRFYSDFGIMSKALAPDRTIGITDISKNNQLQIPELGHNELVGAQ